MEDKLVSVIIPTYKRPLKLSRAINSVLNQTYSNIEILVVDDNNPNTSERKETEELMSQYENNNQVKYLRHECNKNGSAARNTGFKNSSGEYIMLLDDDDEFLPRKVEVQVKCLESKDGSWGACYTKYKRLRNGKVDTICAENSEGNLYFEELCRNLFIQAGSNLMVRRSVFKELNGFNESFSRNQDIEFAVRLLKKYKLAYVDEMGLIYHRHLASEKRFFDMEKITNQYIENFQSYIDELSDSNKKKFYQMVNLQLFRYRLITTKNVKSSYNMIKSREVTAINVLRYFIHLGYRKVAKKSYGFKL
ncbi:glycosyltransferase family 2 protein [Priestia megaterium]|uniref:glycosyltransferase family 2 protein n=1 Tax=Priestia megaterium TaxID=1404 RepID=UPI000D52438F|nr:glycosyltransferase family 2 protein [Priestia megaterium]PVE67193.1 glycosyl transferase family 2 [Priestia megaterium]PVE84281.1 glycosyl transferase family 2 [Priestia megaterium]PVE91384.1 glycosyl transferase family 2 [Priestia megaterium]PVE94471.1 glycosyl transferase family 2 [Priestia megaterium]